MVWVGVVENEAETAPCGGKEALPKSGTISEVLSEPLMVQLVIVVPTPFSSVPSAAPNGATRQHQSAPSKAFPGSGKQRKSESPALIWYKVTLPGEVD